MLAVDQVADERAEKPSVAKAVTLEVDITGAQKLSLASQIGTLSLLLRKAGETTSGRTARRALKDLMSDLFAATPGPASPRRFPLRGRRRRRPTACRMRAARIPKLLKWGKTTLSSGELSSQRRGGRSEKTETRPGGVDTSPLYGQDRGYGADDLAPVAAVVPGGSRAFSGAEPAGIWRQGVRPARDPDLRRETHAVGEGPRRKVRGRAHRCAVHRRRVGDPKIADVNPLTDRALSILGKKIGTTRVSIYAEGKKLIGIFDVEVSYDTSALAERTCAAISPVETPGHVGQRPYRTPRHRTRRRHARPRGRDRETIRPGSHQLRRVTPPQQVLLEVRFVEISRTAGRELGVQWNVFGKAATVNVGSQRSSSGLPITSPTSSTNIPAGEIAAGVLSGASPFGFALGRMINGGTTVDVLLNALEAKGIARSLANRTSLRCPGIPRVSWQAANTQFRSRASSGRSPSTTSVTASALPLRRDGAGRKPDQPQDRARGQSDRSDPHGCGRGERAGAGADRAAGQYDRRAARDGQSFMIGGLLQSNVRDADRTPAFHRRRAHPGGVPARQFHRSGTVQPGSRARFGPGRTGALVHGFRPGPAAGGCHGPARRTAARAQVAQRCTAGSPERTGREAGASATEVIASDPHRTTVISRPARRRQIFSAGGAAAAPAAEQRPLSARESKKRHGELFAPATPGVPSRT